MSFNVKVESFKELDDGFDSIVYFIPPVQIKAISHENMIYNVQNEITEILNLYRNKSNDDNIHIKIYLPNLDKS